MSFSALLAAAEALPDGFAVAVPEDWHQGRTVYGGCSAALALCAARGAGGEGLPPLRSAQVSFVGPLHGRLELRARVLRRGRNATWIAAEIACAGSIGLVANFVFMAGRASALALDSLAPPASWISPEAAEPIPFRPTAPRFMTSHFELRHALARTSKAPDAIACWVRLREAGGLDPVLALLLAADALPPGMMRRLAPATPVSSMTWQCNLLTPAAATRDGWLLLRSAADFAAGGAASQQMMVWNADGVALASGMQAVAVFG